MLRLLSCFVRKQHNLVLFGAYLGNRFGDNSGALYKHCLAEPNRKFRYVWLTNYQKVESHVKSMGGESYRKTSLQGLWLSLRTRLIVTSHGTQDVLLYRPIPGKTKELYLHHGIPLRKAHLTKKKHGLHDAVLLNDNPRNITYMAATSPWGARQQQRNVTVSQSKLRITGYPRNDIFFRPVDAELHRIMQKYGFARYNILYAPTWRKWGGTRFFPFVDFDLESLVQFLRKRKISIILRPHSVDMSRQKGSSFWATLESYHDVIKVITIDEYADTQGLMLLADCLITDYSSIIYDYLLLNRPIVFLPYDIDEYSQHMGGFLGEYEQLTPGPKATTQSDLLKCLEMFQKGKDVFSEKRRKIGNLAHTFQDGQSSARVLALMREMLTGSR